MGFYAKKSLVGSYKEVDSREEAGFYVMGLDEYDSSLEEIRNLRAELKRTEQKANADLYNLREACRSRIAKITDQHNQETLQMQRELDEMSQNFQNALEAMEILESMNRDLKRIARERANQQRGITPKKEHDGYIVLRAEQFKEKWVEPDPNKPKRMLHREADVWKSVIQSPVDASFTLEEVEETLLRGMDKVLREMGCSNCRNRSENGTFWTNRDPEDPDNMLYKWKFRADYKAGLWEIDVYTWKALIVPENRRPSVRKRA